MPDRHRERLTDLAGPRAQCALVMQSTPTPHGRQPMCWLNGPDQDRRRRVFRFADKIHAPVDAVGPVIVEVSRRTEHLLRARGHSTGGMGGRLCLMVGLAFNNSPADAI